MNKLKISDEMLLKEVKDKLIAKSASLLNALKDNTPVDTGKARDSWELKIKSNKHLLIHNDVDYIDELNAGTSKQAPAFFIESTALAYGKPVGSIVTKT